MTDTPRTDECLAGKAHGNAIEYLARDLERELFDARTARDVFEHALETRSAELRDQKAIWENRMSCAQAERDEARRDAEALAALIQSTVGGLYYLANIAPIKEGNRQAWHTLEREMKEALSAHKALTTKS